MTEFVIRCPGCRAINTLAVIVRKESTYMVLPMASPTNPQRGTYHLGPISKQAVHKLHTTVCSGCGWSQDGYPLAPQVVHAQP